MEGTTPDQAGPGRPDRNPEKTANQERPGPPHLPSSLLQLGAFRFAHRSDGTLDPSFWQNCFSSVLFFGHLMCEALFKSFHGISTGPSTEICLSHYKRQSGFLKPFC